MKQNLNQKNKRGYTLMEIMVVVIVVGILASIALPRYSFTMERAKSAEGLEILGSVSQAQKVYQIENGNYTTNLANLDVTFDTIQYFNAPSVFDPLDPVANPIASIQRSSGLYTFSINENGTITCSGDPTACSKLGY